MIENVESRMYFVVQTCGCCGETSCVREIPNPSDKPDGEAFPDSGDNPEWAAVSLS